MGSDLEFCINVALGSRVLQIRSLLLRRNRPQNVGRMREGGSPRYSRTTLLAGFAASSFTALVAFYRTWSSLSTAVTRPVPNVASLEVRRTRGLATKCYAFTLTTLTRGLRPRPVTPRSGDSEEQRIRNSDAGQLIRLIGFGPYSNAVTSSDTSVKHASWQLRYSIPATMRNSRCGT